MRRFLSCWAVPGRGSCCPWRGAAVCTPGWRCTPPSAPPRSGARRSSPPAPGSASCIYPSRSGSGSTGSEPRHESGMPAAGAGKLLGTWAPPPAAFVWKVLAMGPSEVVPSHPLAQQSGPGWATVAPLKIMMMRVVHLQLPLGWWENIPKCKWGDLTLT